MIRKTPFFSAGIFDGLLFCMCAGVAGRFGGRRFPPPLRFFAYDFFAAGLLDDRVVLVRRGACFFEAAVAVRLPELRPTGFRVRCELVLVVERRRGVRPRAGRDCPVFINN